jgi:hypothetical protein
LLKPRASILLLDTFKHMLNRVARLSVLITGCMVLSANAQDPDSAFFLAGTVYNDTFEPIPLTHVINTRSGAGVVTDSLGIFRLPVRLVDTLLIRNIAYRDTLVPVSLIYGKRLINLKRVYYTLQEARVFEWGSSYDDFREAIIGMSNVQSLGESMGLPRADPDYVPIEMDNKRVRSAGYLLTSPISYFYHNFNRKAKSARSLFWTKKDMERIEAFDAICSPGNLLSITGLQGSQLLEFMAYLFQRMTCDYRCSEFEVYNEIYAHWEVYRQIMNEIN